MFTYQKPGRGYLCVIVRGLGDDHAKFRYDEAGATAIEYALIAGLLSIAIVAAVQTIGTNLVTRFTTVATALK